MVDYVNVKAMAAKKNLLNVSRRLKDEYGVFLIEKEAKDEIKKAVEELENTSTPPTYSTEGIQDLYLGDWTLLCTTATNQQGLDTSKFSFLQQDPLKKIRDAILEASNKYLLVQQRIRSSNNDGVIDRIDHSLEYQPPEQLRDFLDNLPEQISGLNINPLHVSKSKLILIHKASIIEESSSSPLKTKLSLDSVVLNVAGTSTILDPSGKDVAAIRVPLGEFINTGTFETTYLDDTLRISRGKQGFSDQLRVFVRAEKLAFANALDDVLESKVTGTGVDQSDVDVDELQDEEWVDLAPSD